MEITDGENFWEKRVGDEFPQIERLSKMKWDLVSFDWRGKTYGVRSYQYEYDSKYNKKEINGVLFGLYDLSNPEDRVPVGYFSGERKMNEVEFSSGEHKFIEGGLKEIDLDGLSDMALGFSLMAVAVEEKLRNTSHEPKDLSYLFHTIVLATLSQMGVEKVAYLTDVTEKTIYNRAPQFLGKDFVVPVKNPSYYTKYANVIEQRSNEGFLDTIVSTKITGVQWSMLKEAFHSSKNPAK